MIPNRHPSQRLASTQLLARHTLHMRLIRPYKQSLPLITPNIPLRRARRTVRIRIIRAYKTSPISLHKRDYVLVCGGRIRFRGGVCCDVVRSPDCVYFDGVFGAVTRGVGDGI